MSSCDQSLSSWFENVSVDDVARKALRKRIGGIWTTSCSCRIVWRSLSIVDHTHIDIDELVPFCWLRFCSTSVIEILISSRKFLLESTRLDLIIVNVDSELMTHDPSTRQFQGTLTRVSGDLGKLSESEKYLFRSIRVSYFCSSSVEIAT